ncbi:MAG TPA: maleylpyruvate isomerase family mycothiol-dependent enzyme [Nocardioides sp.]|uniref:maleylpyruvate isomerase family mycothiol-dependent enzyme n=1 Tax=Nocardioides sp. TaxID=35761 RepID=UPI002ED7F385
MSDRERLAGYVETWWEAIGDLTALLDSLSAEEWALPTDLPGWDVKAVASHTAHLESILAGAPEETAEIGEPAHVTSLMGAYTEIGVVNRRDRSPQAVVAEIRDASSRRRDALLADPPTDGSAKPTTIFGGVGWDWSTLLRNRPLDVWMHEQDIRRAVGRPGGLESRAAQHTADYLTEGFGYVVGKRVAPPAGTTAVLAVAGSEVVAVAIDETGRARRLPEEPAGADVRLTMDRETFVLAAGGRRVPAPGAVTVTGDAELGERILARLATTP